MSDREPPWPVRFGRWLSARPSGVWVGTTGFGAVAVSAIGYFMRLDQAPTIAFLILGSGLVFASPLIDRLEGQQKLSGTGFEMNVLARREHEVETGQVLPLEPPATIEQEPTVTETADDVRVVVAQDAINELRSFDDMTRDAVYRAFADLARQPLEELRNVHRFRADSDERNYYVLRSVPNVGVIFRQLDKTSPDEPTRYVVLQVLPSN